jgi:hypothetical protein
MAAFGAICVWATCVRLEVYSPLGAKHVLAFWDWRLCVRASKSTVMRKWSSVTFASSHGLRATRFKQTAMHTIRTAKNYYTRCVSQWTGNCERHRRGLRVTLKLNL